MEKGVHAFVEGEVMSGHYRLMLKRLARDKGVRGWARPLVDGRIEAAFGGDPDAVDEVLGEIGSASLTGRLVEDERSESLVAGVETRELGEEEVRGLGEFRLVHGNRLNPSGIGLKVEDCADVEVKGRKLLDPEGEGGGGCSDAGSTATSR